MAQCFNARAAGRRPTYPRVERNNSPTNFHVEKIRQCNKKLDLSYTIREAMEYLETREEEITEELSEHKRRTLISINVQREEILARLEEYIEGLREYVEDQFISESTRAVEIVQSLKQKLIDLNNALGEESSGNRPDTPSVLRKLKRQAEIISNIANEMEELKSQADNQFQLILDKQLGFAPGEFPFYKLDNYFGVLQRTNLRRKASLENLNLIDNGEGVRRAAETAQVERDGFSILSVRSWSQSWSILVLGIFPAVLFGLLLKVLYTFVDE